MKKFLHYKMIIIFGFLIGLIILFHDYQLDIYFMTMIFDENKGFTLQNNFWLEKVFHKGGVLFVGAIGIGIILKIIYLFKKFRLNKEKIFELAFLFCSILISVCLIKYLKSITTLPCPWNLEAYGGTRDFQSLTTLFSKDFRIGYCFPSGHASAGYGFLALYFAKALHQRPELKNFLPGLCLGLLYGMTQQLRGAHFLSHDIATILISLWIPWTLSFIIYLYRKTRGHYNSRIEK
jgi:membrane-associated PAP2 superfamily phosphatase